MIRVVRPILPLLCILVLAAHFLREEHLFLMLACFFSIPFLFIRRSRVVRWMQVVLVIAGIEWIRTTYVLVMQRIALALPWMPVAAILISVAIATAGSALLLNGRDLNAADPG
jgi:hypothetical protein